MLDLILDLGIPGSADVVRWLVLGGAGYLGRAARRAWIANNRARADRQLAAQLRRCA